MSVLARDCADDGQTGFSATAEPYRRELPEHCYRMTGSLHDAEDLVQETLLRAWKASDCLEGRSSVRTWLHRIANGQPAAAMYMRAGERHPPFQLHVLNVTADGVSRVAAFLDTRLFAKFILSERL